MNVRASIAEAAREGQTDRRNALMAWAHDRGATIAQLCSASGLASKSTVWEAIRRAARDRESILDAETPEHLTAEVWECPF